MSNEVLNESFFSNKEIPVSEKVGLTALLLGGTYEQNAKSPDGKDESFVSMVFKRGGAMTPVCFTYGHPETLTKMAGFACLKGLGVGGIIPNLENVFDGSLSDEAIVEKLNSLYMQNPNIDKSKFPENYTTLIAPRIETYFEKVKQYDTYLANNPKIIQNTIAACDVANKKKQPMNPTMEN